MQPRFEKRTGSAPYSLLDQPRFRAGFDFLRLRAQTGEIEMELAEWWEKFSTAYDDERHAMIEEARRELQSKPQAPRVRVRRPEGEAQAPRSAAPGDADGDAPETFAEQGAAAVPKKRRRRRKPANRGAAGGDAGAASAPAGNDGE